MNPAAFQFQIQDPSKPNDPTAKILDPQLDFVTNAAGKTVRFGDLGRNTFKGPSIYKTDISFFKNTSLTERWKLQIST